MKPEVQGHEGDDRDDREHDTDQCGEKIQSDPCENDNRAGVVGDIIIVHNTPPLLAPDVQEQVVGDRVEHEYEQDTDRCGEKVQGDKWEYNNRAGVVRDRIMCTMCCRTRRKAQ